MGTYDISRINFDPKKHYSSVRMQQGRVLTDDDWNENERIENEDRRRSRVDIIGPFGSSNDGFKIGPLANGTIINAEGLPDFIIKAGSIYLGGWRLDLEEDETYRLQKDWLQQPLDINPQPQQLAEDRYDLVYLEVWLQPVSAIEDGSLFEAALGGPDTTTRYRAMRRVRITEGIGFCDCVEAWNKQVNDWKEANRGTLNKEFELISNSNLQVGFTNEGVTEDLCTPSAAGGYLGAENQAIRVQLTDSGHFTWGFDDAAPLYKVTVSADGSTVKMISAPKDQYHWPLTNQVVEILPWSAVLSNGEKVAAETGFLTKLQSSYDPDTNEFTLTANLPAGFGSEWKSRADADELDNQDPSEYFYLRVWNRGDDFSSPAAISFTAGTAVPLGHTGLQVTLTGTEFNAGDYWVIAARPQTPDRVVPWALETGISAHGVRRFFAPLAIINWVAAPEISQGKIVHDCRRKFNPLTDQECCCTFTVGDGIRSRGDFNSIQEAIDNLPLSGGKICVLPGEHEASVSINAKQQIRISGCGYHSIVRPPLNERDTTIFRIRNSQRIQIDQLTLFAENGIAIHLSDSDGEGDPSSTIRINDNNIIAGIHAIRIEAEAERNAKNDVMIEDNRIGMIDKEMGRAAIFSLADDVLIARNRIVVIPDTDRDDPDDPRDPNDPGDLFDPCARFRPSLSGFTFQYQLFVLIGYVLKYPGFGRFRRTYLTEGGIHIGTSSERVRILDNLIIGGRGNGITLGHFPDRITNEFPLAMMLDNRQAAYAVLYGIEIEENKIYQMGLSGISVTLPLNRNVLLWVHIGDLGIFRNTIQRCGRQLPADIPTQYLTEWAFGGIILGDTFNAKIQGNRIEDNGMLAGKAVCGIYIRYGEQIDISGNSILRNGMPVSSPDTTIERGARAGVMLRMAFKTADLKNLLAASVPSFDGVPALTMHDNVIEQPLGHALFATAFGPVSVVNNQMTTLGTDRTNPKSVLASSIYLFNLGVSKDFVMTLLKTMANKDPKAYQQYLQDPAAQQLITGLQYLPSGKVIFSDNQVTLDMRAPTINLSLSSILIVSLDDVAFNNNQTECAGYISVAANNISLDLVILNTFIIAASLRTNSNRFMEGLTFALYSLLSYGLMNTAVGNQSTHCLLTLGSLRSIDNNLVLNNDRCDNKQLAYANALSVPQG